MLPKEEYQLVIDYLYQLAADPYNGPLISGPSNPKGCAQVIYKPNNPQFAQQGGVSSSTRILKLNVDTISTAAASRRGFNKYNANIAAGLENQGGQPDTPFIYKDKAPSCQAQTYSGNPFFFEGQHRNKLICNRKTDGSEYQTYNTMNNGAAGNYIGATQHGGAGYANKNHMPNTTYFDNIRYGFLKNNNLNLISA
jgi:hypothetical protein